MFKKDAFFSWGAEMKLKFDCIVLLLLDGQFD